MTKPNETTRYPTHPGVYLAADLVHSLIWELPSGTAFCIGVVLLTMLTGQLKQHQGSLARAAWPYVLHLRWGWHRVERAMERGRLSLDRLFDVAFAWCLEQLPLEPLTLGVLQREVWAIDTSTIARLRAGAKLGLAGQGYCHHCQRAVRAHIVAAASRVVRVAGVRCGLVRRTRFGATCEQAVAVLWSALRELPQGAAGAVWRLYIVDAGIATVTCFASSTPQAAVLGRLRLNARLRCAPATPVRRGRGRPAQHGTVLHPGSRTVQGRRVDAPEVAPDEELWVDSVAGPVRLRRWNQVHYEQALQVNLVVVRVDDPRYARPLLVASAARELTTVELWQGYLQRWPVETDFFVGQATTAMEQPRAWHPKAVERRISLALLTGCVLKAIAAAGPPLAMGPWDRQAKPTAGRLANHLHLQAPYFAALALRGVAPRNYHKNQQPVEDTWAEPLAPHDWPFSQAA